ncbi:MAG: PD40 domain-containing protein [Planctomycetales bacterium]|nr:PD40 domain-containing protein [Planctomycetales bacterium]
MFRTIVPCVLLACAMQGAGASADETDSEAEKELLAELHASPNKILFESYRDDNWDIFVMNADGSDVRNLTNTRDVHELYPQASPEGGKICFLADVAQEGDTIRSVCYMNIDGSGRTQVADNVREPCWSPDGAKIAFCKQEFSKFNVTDYVSKGLFIYDLKSGETTQHPNDKIHHLYNINWSADGRWFVSTVHGGMGFGHAILALAADGDTVVDLKVGGCRPCLSSDGKRMTWSRDDHTICVADLDLTSPTPAVSNTQVVDHREDAHLYHPDFSPDGKFVTYSVGPGGRVLANGPGTHTQVAEMIGVRGPWDIYVKRADGAGPAVRLTSDPTLCNKESEWLHAAPKESP